MMYLSVIRLAFTSITILICLLLYLRETHQYNDVNIVHKFTMLSKMVIQKMLKGNKKVPAGCFVSNIHFLIIKRKNTIYPKSTLDKTSRCSPYYM